MRHTSEPPQKQQKHYSFHQPNNPSTISSHYSTPIATNIPKQNNKTLQSSTMQNNQNLTMTIKQQETIEQILQQTFKNNNNSNNKQSQSMLVQSNTPRQARISYPHRTTVFQTTYQLDQDIDKLLKQSEQKIEQQYQNNARQQFVRNRLGITIQDEHDRLKQIFQRMDEKSQRSSIINKSKISQSEKQVNQDKEDKQSQGFGDAFNLDVGKLKHKYHGDYQLQNKKLKQTRNRSYSSNYGINQHSLQNKQDNINQQISSQDDSQPNIFPQHKQPIYQTTQTTPYLLDTFQQTQILKPKQQSLQILQLDQKYPKINLTSMYSHQYPIFKFNQSSTTKYLRYLRKSMKQIQCAVSFYMNNNVKWTILAIQGMLYVFIGEDWKQPVTINPHRNISTNEPVPPITCLSLSKSNMYLAVSLPTQILIYQIKKQNNSLILTKNLSTSNDINRKLIKITKIIIYNQNPIKIIYVDNQQYIGMITCQTVMMFMRVNQKFIKHQLNTVIDMDVIMIENIENITSPQKNKSTKFSLNKKLTNLMSKAHNTYCAFTSRSILAVYRIQPNIQLIHKSKLHEQTTKSITIRWRNNIQMSKPQLLISYNNKIYIYKLMQPQQNSNQSFTPYLQLHLIYQNHYDIILMQIISNTHLLLHSIQNIIVIAIPLIPSTDLSYFIAAQQADKLQQQQQQQNTTRGRRLSQCNNQMFQSALVFITNQKDCRILYNSQDQVIYYSNNQQILRIAVLKKLQQYLDQLMIQQSHFRQAFTLLILIYKGVNYSFKFSYNSQSLSQCIFTAVQCTIATLKLSMSDNIVQYRLGWICQLLIQTHNQNMIWSTVYKKLQQKQRQRQKQWEINMGSKLQKLQNKRINQQNYNRQSYSQHSLFKTHKLQRSQTNQTQDVGLNKSKKPLSHANSLILQQTTSAQLLGHPPKSLLYILFDILEVFVLKNQITTMPQNIFFDFISYQCQKMSDTVVEKVIIQNKQGYDGSKLLSLLQNKQRNYLQLYLFSRAIICEDPDFYTPFIKVFSTFKKDSENLKKCKQNQNNEQLAQKVQNNGLMCLWYLSKCFKFQQIPQGIMTLNQKITIVTTMCHQILQPTFTKMLFQFNNKIFIQTMLLMFLGSQLSILIQQNNELLVEKYKQFYPSIYQQIMSTPPSQSQLTLQSRQGNQQIQQIFDKTFKQLAVLHLQISIPMLSNQKVYWAEFQALAFYYNKTQICLTFEATNKFQQYLLHVPSKLTSRPTVQQLQLSLIDYIKPVLVLKKDRFYINKLLSFNDKNVSYYLHRIDQSYKLALQHFLSAKQPKKLIPFIYELLSDIKQLSKNQDSHNDRNLRQRKFADMKQFLVKNIGTIFNIDKFEALNIFYQIGETSQTIYKLIQQNMGNKLNFLTAVLKKFQNQDFDMKQKFQLEHLSQVCMQKDKKMLEYLDKFYYPLDSAIIVCEQKGNLLAKAIFQQRCGKITDAFMSYQRIIKNIIQSNNPAYKMKSQKKIKRDVHKYTQQCLRLCKQYAYDSSAAPQNNFWLRILTFINGFIRSNNQQKVFLKVQFEKVLQHILHQMFQFLPTTLLIDFFIAKGHRLQLSITKQFSIFQNLFMLGKFDIRVENKVLQICKIDIKDTRKQALLKRKHGIISYGYCDFCKKSLLQQLVCNLYSCKHSYHKICHDDIYKCLTCYYQSDDSIVKSNIFGSQLHKLLPQDQQHQNNKIALKHKPLKQMKNIDVIIQSAQAAQQQQIKKKMKVFDFNQQKISTQFYKIIDSYNQKDKQRDSIAKMDSFQNDYLKYTKQGGLQIKQKRNRIQSEDDFSINYNQQKREVLSSKIWEQI